MAESQTEDSPLLESGTTCSLTHGAPIDVHIIAVSAGATHLASRNDQSLNSVIIAPISEGSCACDSTKPLNAAGDACSTTFAQAFLNATADCGLAGNDTFCHHDHHLVNHQLGTFNCASPCPQTRSSISGVAPLAKNDSSDYDDLDQEGLALSSRPPPSCSHCILPSQSDAPKVSFHIDELDEEELEENPNQSCGPNYSLVGGACDIADCNGQFLGGNGSDESKQSHPSLNAMLPRLPSYCKTGMLSASSSTASMPMCRICHFPQGELPDTLISPCRCSGTMQFIHESCLMKWIDVSKSRKGAACELCNYQYNRHKKFRLSHWELPTCSRLDKFLHLIFTLCLIVMATCATITVYCFKQDRFIKKTQTTELSKSEMITLTCGVLFFVAFFLAMYVEVKAKDTLYRLFSRFLRLNQTWHIHDYNKQDDDHLPSPAV